MRMKYLSRLLSFYSVFFNYPQMMYKPLLISILPLSRVFILLLFSRCNTFIEYLKEFILFDECITITSVNCLFEMMVKLKRKNISLFSPFFSPAHNIFNTIVNVEDGEEQLDLLECCFSYPSRYVEIKRIMLNCEMEIKEISRELSELSFTHGMYW